LDGNAFGSAKTMTVGPCLVPNFAKLFGTKQGLVREIVYNFVTA
jgi:hypothetical protein